MAYKKGQFDVVVFKAFSIKLNAQQHVNGMTLLIRIHVR